MQDLPDCSLWQPQKGKDEGNLKEAFLKQCLVSEENIKTLFSNEKKKAINAFEYGLALEEIISRELEKLFPHRYKITNGRIVDTEGRSAGHCDIIFFNEFWFPKAWPGNINNTSNQLFPVDGIYAIGEVKSTLNFETLDASFEKLVKCLRLNRKKTKNRRIVENRESSNCHHGLSNPLYTFIIAESLDPKVSLEDIIDRFIKINQKLKRLEVVRSLCILGLGTLTWSFRTESGEMKPALFMEEDLYKELYATFTTPASSSSSLYNLVVNLQTHLYLSVLKAEDFAVYYGKEEVYSKFAMKHPHILPIDSEWLELLSRRCPDDTC